MLGIAWQEGLKRLECHKGHEADPRKDQHARQIAPTPHLLCRVDAKQTIDATLHRSNHRRQERMLAIHDMAMNRPSGTARTTSTAKYKMY